MITRNAAMCQLCLDVIESKHTHDYKQCRCGNVTVDGGKDYIRRNVQDQSEYLDMSEFDEEDE